MGGDDLNDAVLDDWVHLDDEVLVDEDDGADATESGEERDWRVLRQLLPHTPFLGIYGSGQMTLIADRPRLMQNSCVLALAGTPQET